VVDDHDVLADVFNEVELMAREEDPHAGGGQLSQDRRDSFRRDGVQAGERLVGDQEVGIMDERGRELHALLVAVREPLQASVGSSREAEPLQPAAGRIIRLRMFEPGEPGEIGELLAERMRGYSPRSSGM
jgi:hypothetical protein